ncbi:hypothetical protein NPX13_g7269 [Xylaria arbuscula]|uniref:Xylanolytic transcriptional activator regulatory domain-containing protein n=1 Tax=Xylaria arbuscula TaxID=114810 RepID=A0A9W8NAB7_9PEZI|nr:hypothetical protein NPX13_g7269 [Xylaria arbuscula]
MSAPIPKKDRSYVIVGIHLRDKTTSEVSSETLFSHNDPDGLYVNDGPISWDFAFTTQFEALNLPMLEFGPPAPPQTAAKATSFSQFSSGLPPLDLVEDANDSSQGNAVERADDPCHLMEDSARVHAKPWLITTTVFEKLREEIQAYSSILPDECELPTSNSISRGLETYLTSTQLYLPYIHVATYSVEGRAIELSLALAALGLLYRFEHSKAYKLYFLAKAIWYEKNRREGAQLASEVLGNLSHAIRNKMSKLRKMQTLIALVGFASWGNRSIRPCALSMAAELALLAREFGLSEDAEEPPPVDWRIWVAAEERRRTILSAYILSSRHNIIFGVPPLILNREINILLPDYSQPWKSWDALQWQLASHPPRCSFQEGLRFLYEGNGKNLERRFSSFSCYIMIIGILQQTWIDRHSSYIGDQLSSTSIETFDIALRAWQVAWEGTDEPVLDPLSSRSSTSLASASLLRLAYIRLVFYRGTCRGVLYGDLTLLNISPALDRSLHVERAVLHAAHALSVSVRLGITFMANTKTSIWSIEHSIASVESALLLKTWLAMISTVVQSSGTGSLRAAEKKLLGIVTSIIEETDLSEILQVPDHDPSRYQHMAIAVIKLWSSIFQGSHILEFDDDVRYYLRLAAESIQL